MKFIKVLFLFSSSFLFSQSDIPAIKSPSSIVDTNYIINNELLQSGRCVVTREDTDLKELSTHSSKTLVTIPSGKYLEWIGFEFGYWKVRYGNHEGFINEILVECKKLSSFIKRTQIS